MINWLCDVFVSGGVHVCTMFKFFVFRQKTAYEMRISDWSSDVCSSDLFARDGLVRVVARGAFLDARGVEEAGDAVARLGADAQPMLRAVGVELHALGIVLGEQRVVAADALDEAAVARAARIDRKSTV